MQMYYMKRLFYYNLKIIKSAFSNEKSFIRNKELPVCVNCAHFIEKTNNYPYDPVPNDKLYGKCKKFGEMDLITGVIEYDFAKYCRDNNEKCGKTGLGYTDKTKV
jgi:hypothetical protein